MIVRGRDFDDIYDLVGIRVLVDSVRDCYAVLGVLHARWNPVPGPVQGLHRDAEVQHVPVAAHHGDRPEGKPVEIQIRTHEMHRRAEYGVAAHWKYKDQPNRHGAPARQPARRRHGLAAPAARLAAGDRGPGRVPRVAALRDQRPGGLRLHAQGRRDRAARRRPRRSTSPTRCTPRSATAHRRPGQRPAGAARDRRWTTATWSRSSPRRPTAPARARTGCTSSRAPGPATRSGSGSPRSAARRRSSSGKDAIAKAMRKQNLPLQRLHDPRVAGRRGRRGLQLRRRLRALRRGRRGHTSAPSP